MIVTKSQNDKLIDLSENDELIGMIVRMAFTHQGRPSIAVREWGRDCDHFESTRTFILSDNTNPRSIYWPRHLSLKLLERELTMEMNSEGPCSMTIISEQEYKEFEPYRRDHLAEKAGY
jgi:hypothetical protein